ncbi:MAG: ABC transporter substrate-binding protein [archaeon]|jgi:branched-chain amino acid transport system substrate-binding protein
MKNKTWLIISIAIVVLVLVIAIIGFNSGSTGLLTLGNTKEQTIKIGVLATQTGSGTYFGAQEIKGLNVALDEINANGGINGKKVELIIEDTQSDSKQAINATNKLINIDNVEYIIGDSWNDTTLAIVPVTNDNKVIVISPAANLESLSKNDYMFRTTPTIKDMMIVLADYTYNDLGIRSVGIVLPGTAFSLEHEQYFREEFTKLGGTVYTEQFAPGTIDIKTELMKLKAKNPDAYFDLQFSGTLGTVMQQGTDLELMDKVWLAHYGAQSDAMVNQYKDYTDGLIYTYTYDSSAQLKSMTEFNQKYQAKYNSLPDGTAANSYDALIILAKAIEHSRNDTDKAKEYLSTKIKNQKGASGIISFDAYGNAKKDIIIKQIKNGKFVKISN